MFYVYFYRAPVRVKQYSVAVGINNVKQKKKKPSSIGDLDLSLWKIRTVFFFFRAFCRRRRRPFYRDYSNIG